MTKEHLAKRWEQIVVIVVSLSFLSCISGHDLRDCKKALGFCHPQSSCEAEVRGSCSLGLKQEVKTALRALRDKLLAEQKEKEVRGFKGI